ncbi:FliM/FliN family flagellar motor switch protein [Allosphingosinicella sp.]|jgi:flagellar motor switch protein FliN/FliY|uniref:FliM/FliN family flagellar motor switch protein n=1 Tax=Allosphingosinicella sp. TaxID=2823234 RepID=UPI002F2153B8
MNTQIDEQPVGIAGDDGENRASAKPLIPPDSPVLKEVKVSLLAKLGEARMSIEELLALREGSVLALGSSLNGLVDLCLNDTVVARGEIVAVGDSFGVRIVEVGSP